MLGSGEMVAGYRVDGLLGEGGMGAVYSATQISLNRTVALKVLSSEFGDDSGFRERFRREGLLQAALDHPHIVTVYEAGETEHGLFLAMRLVRGSTLKELILSDALDTRRSLSILRAVADALDSAHEVGLIHRDVKPQNILVGARDHAYLADFGLTKGTGEGRLTETGQFIGTIDYVAPEQVQGIESTARSDVYALTGVLYECLAKEVPFQRATEAAVLYAHISDPPPKLTEKRPDLPAAIDEVIAKGMAKQPDARYATASELIAAAAEALGMPELAPQPPTGVTTSDAPATAAAAAASTRLAGTPTAPAGTPTAARRAATAPAGAVPAEAAPAAREGDGRFLLVAAVVIALLAIAGYLAGGSGSDDDEGGADFANSASAGSIGLSFPSGWARLSEQPATPGMTMGDPIVLAAGSPPDGRLEAGMVRASGPALLPDAFLRRLPDRPPEGDAVALGDLQAYRYDGLDPRGLDRPVTVYTVPTSEGVATVTCSAGGADATALLGECEGVATTLELAGAEAFPLGPNEDYARALTDTFDQLDSERRDGEAALRRAGTQNAQGEAATRLGRTYADAAGSLARVETSPADARANDRIVLALRGTAAAYERVATAARAGDSGAYADATDAVERGGRRLGRALRSLERLGYSGV